MAAARPRRLPTRVYWFRRGLVLVVVLSLVAGVAHLLGATDGDAPAADRASVAAAQASAAPAPLPEYGPLEAASVRPRKVRSAAPAEPSGPCRPQDIATVPSAAIGAAAEQPVAEAGSASRTPEAGRRVTIALALQGTQPACTFDVSPASVAVKVTTEDGEPFWSSQACPGPLPRESVVVRSAEPTVVSMSWSARDSQDGCGAQSRWALPGFYRLHATVQGSTPTEVPFELVRPAVVYKTETPKPRPRRDRAAEPDAADAPAPGAPAPSPDR